jgi:hypothetical protein
MYGINGGRASVISSGAGDCYALAEFITINAEL